MGLPEPETQGHASSQGARVAMERGSADRAVGHLAGGMWWTADMVVYLERRLIALETWAREQGYEPPDFSGPAEDDG